MSIEQVVDASGPWLPREQPADLREFDELVEEAEFEAEVCGDVGFADRVFTFREPEPDRPGWGEDRWTPADPAVVLGRAGWLAACGRELNRDHARFLAAVHQAGHTGLVQGQGRAGRDRSACAEVGAALGWSGAMAGTWLSLAHGVVERLPALYVAMAAGELDVVKARVFVEDTADMPVELARLVVDRLLGRAAGLTKNQLAEQVEVVAAQLDHDWHRRRELAALSRARVEYTRTRAGTAEVAVRDVPAAGGAVIKARVEAIARVLRQAARQADIALGLPALRALVSHRLLDGTYVGLDDDTLTERLVDELPAWHHELFGPDDPPAPDDSRPDDNPDDSGPDDSGPDDSGPDDSGPDDGLPQDGGPDDGLPQDGGPDDGLPQDGGPDDGLPQDGGPDEGGPDDGGPEGAGPDDTDPSTATASTGPAGSAGPVAVRAGTTELRMRLSTALQLDDLPAQLPGSGVLSAHSARRRLADIRAGDTPTEWRVVLVDPDGHLEHVLLARPDPPQRSPHRRRPRRRVRGLVIVELAAPTTMLAALDPTDHPAWAGLIHRAHRRLADLTTRGAHLGGPHHPATTTTDAHRRLPGAALDRFIRVRDRSCIGVGCTGLAHDADIDHTRDWAHHGLTVADNLGPPCRRCHRLKHRDGWQLTQPRPGTFIWRTPLGATYTVPARRVLEPAPASTPAPDQRPRPILDAHRTHRPDDHGWLHPPLRLRASDHIPTPPAPRPARDHPDDPPF